LAEVTRIDMARKHAAPGKAGPRQPIKKIARPGPVSAAFVRELVERTVTGLGYELVDVERAANGLLRVTLDTLAPPGAVKLEDCERVSRQLTHLFAVEQVSFERLEVSSPGLDRPLIAARDYLRFAGSPVQVQLRSPLNGRRRWRGRLLGLCGDPGAERVQLTVPAAGAPDAAAEQTVELPLVEVEKARLVPQFEFGPAPKAKKEGRR